MMRPRVLLTLLLSLSAMLLAAGCEEKIKPSVLPGIDPANLPQEESWNSTIVLSDSGKMLVRIRAGYIQKFDGRQETNMSQGIVVYFYNEKGQQTTVMRASRGLVNGMYQLIRARWSCSAARMASRLFTYRTPTVIYCPAAARTSIVNHCAIG